MRGPVVASWVVKKQFLKATLLPCNHFLELIINTTANGDDIATFLSAANPNWLKKDLTEMLKKHLELTTGEVVSRLKKDWEADTNYYDKGHMHMLMFADILTDGIEKQFPKKF